MIYSPESFPLLMAIRRESYPPVNMLDLPDDLLLNCLARVSRFHHQTLSLVSKRFRSLIASLELYKIRTILGRTENCLYLCLSFSSGSDPRWFTLCQRPTRTPKPKPNSSRFTACFSSPSRILEEKSSGNVMVSVPAHDFDPYIASARIAVGSNIYMIGGYHNAALSSRVLFMDCRSHTWHEGPSMGIAREKNKVSVLDGKIFVVEGCPEPGLTDLIEPGSSDLVEVFDPRTQMWEHLPSPRGEIIDECFILKSLAMDGKLYVFGTLKSMVYEPKANRWDVVEDLETTVLKLGTFFSSCVIDNVIYSTIMSRRLQWYDSEGRLLRVVKGLEELPKLPKHPGRVKLVDYGGKVAVLWDKKARAIVGGFSNKKMIWCAVIAVERRNGQEVYGNIEWCDVVLTVPRSCRLVDCLVVNV